MRIVGGAVLAVVLLVGLPWVFVGNDFFLYRYFAPKQEAVRRQVFENTKSYRQGMVQELQNMQFQYEQAAEAQKPGLRSIILHRAADVPPDALTPDLVAFLARLRSAS